MIYVTGDLHGELARFSERQMKVVKKRDTLLVCGDFGFVWDGGKEEQKALKTLGKLPFTIAFGDGAHENFELLGRLPVSEWCSGRAARPPGTTEAPSVGVMFGIEGGRGEKSRGTVDLGGAGNPDIREREGWFV